MIDVITILGFSAAVYVIIILAVILAVWRAAGEPARPVYERYDPARHEFPRDVSAWLEANANALSREGFAVAGDLLRLGPPTTQRVLLILNDVTEERGMVAAVLGSKGGGGMFVEFTAERPDGRAPRPISSSKKALPTSAPTVCSSPTRAAPACSLQRPGGPPSASPACAIRPAC